jgi:hypothetical protein
MINKSFILLVTILFLVNSILAEIQVEVVDANPAPYDSSGTSNVEVLIISPQNKTYDSNNIELIVNFGAYPGVWYKGYSLDGSSYIEITPGHLTAHNLTETLSLSQLPEGSHSIEVKAYAMANDEDGKVIACSKVNFAITKTLATLPSSSPISTPPYLPPNDRNAPHLEPTFYLLPISVIVAIIAIAIFIYRRMKINK